MKLSTFFGTRRFITALTSARHLSQFWARAIQSMSPHSTLLRSIWILFLLHLWQIWFCMLFYKFVSYGLLLSYLCILIIMDVSFYSYCYVCSVLLLLLCMFCSIYSVFIVQTGTLRLPWLRFFRAFSSVARQMPGYISQRRDTARTLPK
jgi:hypothetical protein